MCAHLVLGEPNALQSEVQLEGRVVSHVQISKQGKGQAVTSGGSALKKSMDSLGVLPRS